MGMFDWIKYEGKCPKCGELLTSWQSKNSDCLLSVLEPWEVDNFYCSCDKCGAWIEASVDADVETTVVVNKCEVTLKARE